MSLIRLNLCKPIQNKESKETYDIIYNKNLYRAKIHYEDYESYQFYKPSVNLYVFRDLVEKHIEKAVPFLNKTTGEIWIEIPIFGEYFIKIYFEKVNLTFSTKKRLEDLEKEIEDLKKGIGYETLVGEFPLPKWESLEEFKRLPEYKYIEIAKNWKDILKTFEIDKNGKETFHDMLITDGTKKDTKYYLYLSDLNGEKYVFPFNELTTFQKQKIDPKTGNEPSDGMPYVINQICNRISYPGVVFPRSYQYYNVSDISNWIPLGLSLRENKATNVWSYTRVNKFYKAWTYQDFENRGYSRGSAGDGSFPITERFFETSQNTLDYNIHLYFLFLAFGWTVENLTEFGSYKLTFKILMDGRDNIKMNIYKGEKIEPYDFLENPVTLLFGNFNFTPKPTLY